MTRRARLAALAAFALGAIYGVLTPAWQVAVEPAQVLAGLVRYPEGNPNLLYQANTWTILHQLVVLGLKAGVSEAAASVTLSAVIPGIVFSGLALWMMALLPATDEGGGLTAALLVPFMALGLEGLGVHYPILIAGWEHTYGMAGMAMTVLGIGLLANGAWAGAGFALALGPAVHPSLGFWTGLAALLAWPWRDPGLAAPTRRLLGGMAGGAAVGGVSLAVHLLHSYRSVALAADERRVYLDTFVSLWDGHRQPLHPFDWTVLLAAVVGLAAMARLVAGPAGAKERILDRFVAAVMLTGLAAAFAARALPGPPGLLLVLMPSRFLNVLLLGSMPLAVGWLWASGSVGRLGLAVLAGAFWLERVEMETVPRLLAAAIGLALALGATSRRSATAVLAAAAALGLYAAAAVQCGFPLDDEAALWLRASAGCVVLAGLRAAWAHRPGWPAAGHRARLAGAASVICLAEMALVAGRRLETQVREAEGRYLALAAPAADDALKALARGQGVAAVGSDFYLIQLYTRRPVLLETAALDFIPYTPEAGPEVVRILRILYACDYFRPSVRGLLDGEELHRTWSARTTEEWRRVARELGFRDVLVSAGWTLALPEIARSDTYVLYRVPD